VIQAGHAVHLRVLPPPAVVDVPVELVAVDATADTVPLPEVAPLPVRIAAAVALASRAVRRLGQRAGRRRERRAGRLPSPGWQPAPGGRGGRWPWLGSRPLPGRGRR
jgi:hypothetical protein